MIESLISALQVNGAVRFLHFGLFKIVPVKGRTRYDFKKRKIVPTGPYNLITFSPAKGLRDMFNTKR